MVGIREDPLPKVEVNQTVEWKLAIPVRTCQSWQEFICEFWISHSRTVGFQIGVAKVAKYNESSKIFSYYFNEVPRGGKRADGQKRGNLMSFNNCKFIIYANVKIAYTKQNCIMNKDCIKKYTRICKNEYVMEITENQEFNICILFVFAKSEYSILHKEGYRP